MANLIGSLCRLCLFKTEEIDEICLEDSQQIQLMLDVIFKKMVSSKLT